MDIGPHRPRARSSVVAATVRVQRDGGDVIEVRPGDTVWFEPDERHWHGAALNRTMVHLAIQRADETGSTATWQEHVSDASQVES